MTRAQRITYWLVTAAAVVIVALFAACTPLAAQKIVFPIVATSAIATDCGTTLHVLGKGPQYFERNPILGKHPMPSDVVGLCLLGTAATLGIGHLLPKKARPWFNVGVAVIEFAAALHNSRVR